MRSAGSSRPQGHVTRVLLIMGVLQALLGGLCEASWAQGTPLTFSVTGDVPYSEGDLEDFRDYSIMPTCRAGRSGAKPIFLHRCCG